MAKAADKHEKETAEAHAHTVRLPFLPVSSLSTLRLTTTSSLAASERPLLLSFDLQQLPPPRLLVPHPPLHHVSSLLSQLLQALRWRD
jgi:hypothetical protein